MDSLIFFLSGSNRFDTIHLNETDKKSAYFKFLPLSRQVSCIIQIIILLLISSLSTYSQTDWVKWGKADYNYQIDKSYGQRDYSFDFTNPGRFLLKSFVNGYWFFISDVDGDNCSFNPTCSNFFVQSVEQTNILQGTLMFFDRFTRDMDIFGKLNHYPRVPDGHLYDPPSNYLLVSDSIKYIRPSLVIRNE